MHTNIKTQPQIMLHTLTQTYALHTYICMHALEELKFRIAGL